MILRRLRIKNFRQIAGEYSISFGSPGSRNVTVVLGENGSGKSTLLNAFRWCLYGSIDLENPSELLSHFALYQANIGDNIEVEIELQFEHSGTSYQAFRHQAYEKVEGGDSAPKGEEVFEVTEVVSNGETRTIADPVGFMLNLLPENLSRFFFFQGESISQLALQRSKPELKDGVETFLDFRVLDRATSHLRKVGSDLEKELRDIASADVLQVQEEIDKINSEIEDCEAKLDQVRRNMQANANERDKLRLRLTEVEDFRPIFQEIEEQKLSLVHLRNQRRDAIGALCDLISENGYMVFASDVFEKPIKFADEAVERGELPAKIKPQFVADLIERGECICGDELDDRKRQVLMSWRKKTGLADLEEGIASLRRGIYEITNGRRPKLLESLPKNRGRMSELDEKIRTATEKKSAAERRVANVSVDEEIIRGWQRRHEELYSVETDLKVKESRIMDQIGRAQQAHDAKSKERHQLAKSKNKEALISRRIECTNNVRDTIQRMRTNWTKLVQQFLDTRLKASWQDVAQLPRRVSFNSDFSLSIEERGGSGEWVTSAPSEANCAVLALTFVSALISFARELGTVHDDGGIKFGGGEFPLVMDAPFAKMDEEFKQRVPSGIAAHVPQVILISNLDQWSGDVASALGKSIGAAYVLVLHRPGESGAVRQVEAFGKNVDYVVVEESGATDWTAIQEVQR